MNKCLHHVYLNFQCDLIFKHISETDMNDLKKKSVQEKKTDVRLRIICEKKTLVFSDLTVRALTCDSGCLMESAVGERVILGDLLRDFKLLCKH